MSLRILHVTPYAEGAWAYGGIPRLTSTLTRALARRGHHVTVCSTDACSADARLPKARADDDVALRVFPNVSNRLAYHWQCFTPLGFGAYMREHARTFDVAHLHACRNLPGAIAARHLRRAGIPYVLAPNGTAPVIERRRLAKHVFDATVGRGALERADCVLAVSNAERAQLAALGVPEHRVRMIPNPIDLDEFATPIQRGRFRARHELGDAPVVLFLGKITPRKRLPDLARAVARLRDPRVRLVIAGNDMGGLETTRALIASLGIAVQTSIVGLLESRERLEALADADVVAYPSANEIFGLVPIEALLCGTPVVVADDSGCGEVIDSLGGGDVVRLGDVAALTRALADVLAAPAAGRLRARGAAGRIRERYSGDVIADAMTDLYRDLVAAAAA